MVFQSVSVYLPPQDLMLYWDFTCIADLKRVRKNDRNRVGALPRLRQQNKVTDTRRYGIEKLSPLLPEVQTGKFD